LASTNAEKRYRTVVGWNYKSIRSEPGQLVPKSIPEKVLKSLERQGAIEIPKEAD
jgi:hypothetical protein